MLFWEKKHGKGDQGRKAREVWNCRSRKHPARRSGQGPGSVDPRFLAGFPFPVPEMLEFVACRDSGIIFQQFSPQTPEAATAFSSFLKFLLVRPTISDPKTLVFLGPQNYTLSSRGTERAGAGLWGAEKQLPLKMA